jgi:D-alanine-D-alanine ligase
MLIHVRETEPHRISDAALFGRVAVMLGGDSSEREISLLTGKAVLAALRRRGVDAQPFDPSERSLMELSRLAVERVWIALHGPGGEDGTLQGALELLGIPYTGSGVLGSAIGMDKVRTKRLAQAVGIATPDYEVLTSREDLDFVLERLGLPLFVKPAFQGSSVGVVRVDEASQLEPAWHEALRFDSVVLAERCITGGEYTVAMLQGQPLPSIRIETARGFYDYEAKYLRDDTRYHCPSGLSAPAEQHLGRLAAAVFDACGAEGWGRADFMLDRAGRPLLLEINTVPGMTDHSLVPMAARAAGIDFDELVWRVLETSFARTPRQHSQPAQDAPRAGRVGSGR